MGIFKLPKGITNNIDRAVAHFVWQGDLEGHKVHWKAWRSICMSKFHGGLGMHADTPMNHALLARLAWKILENPQTLLARIYSAKYCRQQDFLHVQVGKSAMWGWRGILWGRDLLSTGLKWHLANGHHVPLTTNWIPGTHNPLAFDAAIQNAALQVDHLIHPSEGWNISGLENLFLPQLIPRILSIYLPVDQQTHSDHLYWSLESHGRYSVRSGYYQACNLTIHLSAATSTSKTTPIVPPAVWKKLWNAAIPEEIKFFLWRALSDACPTLQALLRRGKTTVAVYFRCGAAVETISHLLLDCTRSQHIWRVMQALKGMRESKFQNRLVGEETLNKGDGNLNGEEEEA
ncbi:OLC1v1019366C1 [Oldenlandia corymbosa var. corymbosa]|uniref:OLC1v1019366C1 n=1 Tax=Oldenlandia corymbosa var. corymbosa TaxID=529605 RepID=A0AAV1EE72_OLDCO|nr:OLC1v1019366C1 [Oldenlandia corymbosa var. corymbosa]